MEDIIHYFTLMSPELHYSENGKIYINVFRISQTSEYGPCYLHICHQEYFGPDEEDANL